MRFPRRKPEQPRRPPDKTIIMDRGLLHPLSDVTELFGFEPYYWHADMGATSPPTDNPRVRLDAWRSK